MKNHLMEYGTVALLFYTEILLDHHYQECVYQNSRLICQILTDGLMVVVNYIL